MSDRIDDLEIRLAYMDDTVDALNKIVCQQRDEIDLLKKQLTRCQEQLKAFAPLLMEHPDDEPPPPHY